MQQFLGGRSGVLIHFIPYGVRTAVKLPGDTHGAESPEVAPLRFLVLDFHLVSGLDSSAAASFTKLASYSMERGFTVLLAGMPTQITTIFRREGLLAAGGVVEVLSDLDRALEWSENRLLEQERLAPPGRDGAH